MKMWQKGHNFAEADLAMVTLASKTVLHLLPFNKDYRIL